MKTKNKLILGRSGDVCEYPWATVAPGSALVLSGAKPRLDRIIKSTSALPSFEEKNKHARGLRWQRQAAARELMSGEKRTTRKGGFIRGELVSRCMWSQLSKYVEGWKSKSGGAAHFRSVMTCGSVSMCPICAAKITERRKQELESGVMAAHGLGLSVFMVTLTLQHSRRDTFQCVMSDLIKAIEKLRGRRAWSAIVAEYDIVGSVTALEVTYGLLHGWHPHKHILFFTRRQLTQENYDILKSDIVSLYRAILKKAGRGLSRNAIDVRGGDLGAADYIAKYGREPEDKKNKWSLAAEMTKAQVKISMTNDGHYTPFQLLDFYNAEDKKAGVLFREYARVMKGKRVLTWSRGLRDLLGLDVEKTDEEIAAENDEKDSLPFALLDAVAWRKARNIPHDTLEAMRELSFDGFRDYMASKKIFIEPDELSALDVVTKRESIGKEVKP